MPILLQSVNVCQIYIYLLKLLTYECWFDVYVNVVCKI